LIRDVYTIPVAVVAIVGFGLDALATGKGLPVIDMAAGAAIFAGPWLTARLISPEGIGFGDIKLSAGLGLHLGWLGPQAAVVALLASSLVGAAAALVTSIGHDRSRNLPFGPALVVGSALGGLAHFLGRLT